VCVALSTVSVAVAGDKSSTGLLEWESKSDAIEALMCANHVQIPNPSKFCVQTVMQKVQALVFYSLKHVVRTSSSAMKCVVCRLFLKYWDRSN